MTRVEALITGDLPDAGQFRILADVEAELQAAAAKIGEKHSLTLAVRVRPITTKPGKVGLAPPRRRA